MSWDEMFADLQEQFRAATRAEETAQVPHLAEAEMAGVRVADRIRARRGRGVTVRLRDGSTRAGMVQDATRSWFRLTDGSRHILVPLQAVGAVWPLRGSAPEPGRLEVRIGLGHALRALAQQRLAVVVHTEAGDYRGVPIQVGSDHVDLDQGGTVVTVLWQSLLSVEST